MFNDIHHDYTSVPGNTALIVFLPSVRKKDIYPFYPRQSWKRDLIDRYDLLFISDPFQNLEEYQPAGGSWYINQDGKTFLHELAQMVNTFVDSKKYDNVIFYGSSMGGYAAICLAFLCKDSIAIAECPQTELAKHSGSAYVLQQLNVKSNLNPLSFYNVESQPKSITIACSINDHHLDTHVIPFVSQLKSVDFKFDLLTHLFASNSYNKGHVALNKEDAISLIDNIYRKYK